MYISLKAKLGFLTFFCAFISVAAISWFLIGENSREMERMLVENLTEKANIKQSKLSHHLGMIGKMAESLSHNDLIEKIFENPEDDEAARALVQTMQETYWGMIHHTFLIDLEGTVIFSPNRSGSESSGHFGESVAESPFFEKGKHDQAITDFFGFREADHFHQILFQPVLRDGQSIGVVGVEICIDFMYAIFKEAIDKDGVHIVLVTLDGEQVVTNVAERQPPFQSHAFEKAVNEGHFVGLTTGLKGNSVYGVYLHESQWPWILCLEQDAAFIQDKITAARNKSLVLAGGVLLLALAFGWVAATRISKPVSAINRHIVHSIQEHDLAMDIQILSSDEIGRMAKALNGFLDNVRNLVGESKNASSALAQTAGELSNGASQLQTLSTSMEEEQKDAASVSDSIGKHAQELSQQTTGARDMVTDLNQAAVRMDTDLEKVSGLAQESDALVVRTEEAVDRLRASLEAVSKNTASAYDIRNQLFEKVQDARQVTRQLDQSAKSIDQITRTIEKLADQTTLLALNAAIEAEKAGASGRSFGVVALDIKRLANQSRDSAVEINAQISQMQENAGHVDQAMEDVFATMTQLHKMGEEVGEGMEHQITTTRAVSEIVSEESGHLARITEEVADMATGVSQVMARLDSLVSYLGQVDESALKSSKLAEMVRENINTMGVSCEQLTRITSVVNRSVEEINQRYARLDHLVAPYKTEMN